MTREPLVKAIVRIAEARRQATPRSPGEAIDDRASESSTTVVGGGSLTDLRRATTPRSRSGERGVGPRQFAISRRAELFV